MRTKLFNSAIHRFQVIKSQLNLIDKIVLAGIVIGVLICLAL